jgi:chemotaxis protein MotA
MFPAIGVVVVLVMVFGGFMITGGALGPVLAAIPHEMMIIGGAAVGALIAGNSGKELKQLGGGFAKLFKGPQYGRKDYLDTIFLVSRLMKMLRTDGPVAVEPHIEDPRSSPIFAEYPKLLKDETLIHLIADTLRLVVVSSGPWIRTRSRR